MKVVILEAVDGDWTAVYKNGHKVFENHSCHIHDGLEALGIEFERREVQPAEPDFWTGVEFPERI